MTGIHTYTVLTSDLADEASEGGSDTISFSLSAIVEMLNSAIKGKVKEKQRQQGAVEPTSRW